MSRHPLVAITVGVLWWLSVSACAQTPNWPTHPVKIIVAGTPGDGADLAGRVLGVKLQERLGQPFIIVNMPGAGSIIATVATKNAPADGYTFLIGTAGSHGINPAVYASLPYDALSDFEPVFLINKAPNVCVVNPAVPARTLSEFVTLAKRQPGKFTFASGGNGTSAHLTGEYLKMVAGIDMLHVPYKGATAALTAVVSGEVTLFCGNLPPALPQIKAGRVHALAVTTRVRNAEVPEVPTVDESGYPGFESVAWFGYFAPKGTPADVVRKLNAELGAVIANPTVRDALIAQGTVPAGGGPADFRAFIEAEIAKWRRVAHAANIHL